MANAELPIRLDTGKATDQELEFLRVLDSRIIGQASGKKAAGRAFRRALNKLRNGRGPIYKVLQIGKSRTGKTLTAESTALALHGDSEALIFIDCESYKQSHQIQQLLGAPPSYVGYKNPGEVDKQKPGQTDHSALFSQVNLVASRKGSKSPVTVILLDEIEKASEEFLDVLLGIFDKGKIRLANNTETDFTNCIFFMTSNLAMDKVEQLDRPLGFKVKERTTVSEEDIRGVVGTELKLRFRPEFLKRVDETVIFAPLTKEQLEQVVDLEVSLLQERVRAKLPYAERFAVDVQKPAREFILARALADDGGVAEIKQVIETQVSDALGNELAKGTIAGGDLVVVALDADGSKLTLDLLRGRADPNMLVDLDKPIAAGQAAAGSGEALSTFEALAKVRELCEQKLVTALAQRSYSESSISIGSELRKIVQRLGYRGTTWEELHRPIFTPRAYELFWSKIQNNYWYWRLLQECCNQAHNLPIELVHVHRALARLRSQEGILGDYRLDSNSVVARLTVKGMLLIQVSADTQKEELIKNRIFS
jgi:MoxR-like ATPase